MEIWRIKRCATTSFKRSLTQTKNSEPGVSMKPLKIAYIKYNMSINLDPYNHRTSGGVLERLGILKALIEAGHKIVIYSEINSADVDFLQNPPNEFSWLKTVE